MDDHINMTKEKALRWFIQFGSDWVNVSQLSDTWADLELLWVRCEETGYLKYRYQQEDTGEDFRLTQKALDLFMKEEDNVSMS